MPEHCGRNGNNCSAGLPKQGAGERTGEKPSPVVSIKNVPKFRQKEQPKVVLVLMLGKKGKSDNRLTL